jgi:hypothetical protein
MKMAAELWLSLYYAAMFELVAVIPDGMDVNKVLRL